MSMTRLAQINIKAVLPMFNGTTASMGYLPLPDGFSAGRGLSSFQTGDRTIHRQNAGTWPPNERKQPPIARAQHEPKIVFLSRPRPRTVSRRQHFQRMHRALGKFKSETLRELFPDAVKVLD